MLVSSTPLTLHFLIATPIFFPPSYFLFSSSRASQHTSHLHPPLPLCTYERYGFQGTRTGYTEPLCRKDTRTSHLPPIQ